MPDAARVAPTPDGRVTEVRVPGDKSITHRALLLAALGGGVSRVRGALDAADTRATAAALRALGVHIPPLSPSGDEIVIEGVGLDGFRCAPGTVLDCGNSGTTARLLTGLLAGAGVAVTLDGDASLRRRPMDRVVVPLRAMGARLDARDGDLRLPLRVRAAALRAHAYDSPVASAQVKSALLLAGLVAGVPVEVREPTLSRDHTERMLAWMGVPIETWYEASGGRHGERPAVRLAPSGRALRPLDMDVPGDPSSAAYFAAFAALAPAGRLRAPGVSLNPTRIGFFRALARMGAEVRGMWAPAPSEQEGRPVDGGPVEREERGRGMASAGEPRGAIEIGSAPLRAITVEAEDVPAMIDELPLLAVLAARARGQTVVRGAQELRVKESDRIEATVRGLRAVGVDAVAQPDGFRIRGGEAPLRGSVVTRGDHRLAMAFGVLGALPGNHIEIDEPGAVAVSYPGFWEELARVREAHGLP